MLKCNTFAIPIPSVPQGALSKTLSCVLTVRLKRPIPLSATIFLANRSDAESVDPNAFIAEIYRGMSARHAVGKAVPNAGDGKTSRCCGRVTGGSKRAARGREGGPGGQGESALPLTNGLSGFYRSNFP
jgi:hypothetical protein